LPDGEVVAIFEDITGQKEAEIEQEELQRQLFTSQKMETIGAFAGGTAHNFRNILQAISGNIEYLEAIYSKDPDVKELASNIHSSIEKGVGLINNLLHYSKKGWEMEIDILDLADVIIKTHQIIEKVFNENILIKLDLGKNLFVEGSRSLLSQAFMNLFTNARDAMPNGGELQVKAKKTKKSIIVHVSDTGHGIEKDVIDRIFDPFFTLKGVNEGTGLGLSTTQGIIEKHEGSLTVKSQYGKGATFKILLPATNKKIKKKTILKAEAVLSNK
jgi:signal transduction histidine kinase